MELTFSGEVHADPTAHSFVFGGGCRSNVCEDCLVWLPDRGLLIVAAGLGEANGHLESYLDGARLSQLIAGALAGFLMGPDTIESVVVGPEGAAERVAHSWQAAAALARHRRAAEALEAAARLLPHLLAEGVENAAFRYAGVGVEIGAFHFGHGDVLEVAQAGTLGLYRRRDGHTERLVRHGTLGDMDQDAPPGLSHIRTSLVASDGRCAGLFSASFDVRESDRFAVLTRGVHRHVRDEDIHDCLAAEPRQIVPTLVSRARTSPNRGRPPCAAAIVVGDQ